MEFLFTKYNRQNIIDKLLLIKQLQFFSFYEKIVAAALYYNFISKGEMKVNIPKEVAYILSVLEKAGFEAYAVGGCVRDSLLGREPKDWDVTTSASPREVKACFPRTIDTGIQHGTVTVMMGKEGFEVTTYRIDGNYSDGRHPDEVCFTSNLLEDLKRRDFTINAMAYSPERGIVDAFGGQEDLKTGVIRCVGKAEERFSEDALRMMRAIRFSAQLGFAIEEETRKAIIKLAPNLQKVSKERIQAEMIKTLTSPHPEKVKEAWETGLMDWVMPEFDAMMKETQDNAYHCYDVGTHTIVMMQNIPNDKVLRLTALMHDMGKPQTAIIDEKGEKHFYGHAKVSAELAEKRMRDWKMDNDTMSQVVTLIEYHSYPFRRDKKIVRRVMNKIGKQLFIPLMEVMRADTLAKSDYTKQDRLDDIDAIILLYEEIIKDKECFQMKDLAVNGRMLIQAGMKPGKEMGEVLHHMLEHVLEHPEDNNKEFLMKTFMP